MWEMKLNSDGQQMDQTLMKILKSITRALLKHDINYLLGKL